MTPTLTDEQGMLLLGLVRESEGVDGPDASDIADKLVKLGCLEWPYSRTALPTVLDDGRAALWAWLDPGSRAELVEDGILAPMVLCMCGAWSETHEGQDGLERTDCCEAH